VDFVLYGEGIFAGIEVKNSTIIHPNDLRSLRTFKKDYPEALVMLLYRGKHRLLRKNILCIPCEEFFPALHPERSLEDVAGGNYGMPA
jgi:uncharacterized protein